MANVWPVYEGTEPTVGGPWARLPASVAWDLFELRPEDYVSDLKSTPRFGDPTRDLRYAGYKHVVVEVESGEGRKAKWKPGYYRSRIAPKEAFVRLIREAVSAELGVDNVVGVEVGPTTDSRDREALKVTVVIAPDAIRRLREGAALDALVRLQQRLREMGEHRTPIVEYATEAELRQDAGPQFRPSLGTGG